MDKEHAKSISIIEILGKLNIQPTKVSQNKSLYSSPIRKEKTPSFYVYHDTNSWFDYGEGVGGNLIDLIQMYLKFCNEQHTLQDALRWIRNMAGDNYSAILSPIAKVVEGVNYPRLILKDKRTIEHLGLVYYLAKRGIELKLAQKYLKEIHVYNQETGKSFFALGMFNENSGCELRNPFFKGTIKPEAITFIRGKKNKPTGIHLFEDFMDYLSAIMDLPGQAFDEDTIILNSITCIGESFSYIHKYGYQHAHTWMHNDEAGRKADVIFSAFFKTEGDIRHIKMNRIYAPHKDVNTGHMHKNNLKLQE